MLLQLIRHTTSRTAVTGQMWVINPIFGNQLLCDTLEDNTCLIPELIYPLHVTHSHKFGRLLPIINHVPGRDGIRIHAGNRLSDSQGCVLVGHAQGTRLTDSRAVETMVTKLLLSIDQSREDIRLEITHYVPPTPGYSDTDYTRSFSTPSTRTCVTLESED